MRPTQAIFDAIAQAEREGRVIEYGRRAAPTIDPANEAEFQSLVIAEAKRLGWRVYHTFDSRRSEPGFPDLVLLRGRRMLIVELKHGSGKPSQAQLDWLAAFEQAGAEIGCWWPKDWTTILDTLA